MHFQSCGSPLTTGAGTGLSKGVLAGEQKPGGWLKHLTWAMSRPEDPQGENRSGKLPRGVAVQEDYPTTTPRWGKRNEFPASLTSQLLILCQCSVQLKSNPTPRAREPAPRQAAENTARPRARWGRSQSRSARKWKYLALFFNCKLLFCLI